MARTFTRNAANYISVAANILPARLNGAAAITGHCFTKYNGFDATDNQNACRSIHVNVSGTNNTGFYVGVNGSAGTNDRLIVGCRSQAADGLQTRTGTTALSTGQWYSIGGVANIGADTITPYLNGLAEGGGSVTFGAATWTNGTPTGTDQISAPAPGNHALVDGVIAEVALWNVGLTAGEMLALSKGFSALLIRPQSLVFYMPLGGRNSPEPELARGTTCTVNGTLNFADHPRIIYPASREMRRYKTAAVSSGQFRGFFGL